MGAKNIGNSILVYIPHFCYNIDAHQGARPLHTSLYPNIKAVGTVGQSQVSLTGEE